jgi:predicted transposase YdaD
MDDDYDTPWKEVVTHHFPEFMAFYFPQAHAAIDWSRPHDFLDQEFAPLTRDAELGRRVLDKLVRVHLHTGGEQWVLVHLEVQGRHDSDFAERIFVYNYRVYDRYRRPVASLALLTDASNSWRPDTYSYCLLGCQVRIDFPVVKLQDYVGSVDRLLTMDNPFALVTVAHLLTQQTKRDARRRCIAKWRLTKLLYERDWDRQRIINLYRVIDWIMALPPELDARLRHGILYRERRTTMTYMSSIERIGMEIGRKEGRQEGRREALAEMLTVLLTERFGELDAVSRASLAMADAYQLAAWTKNVLAARSLSEVFADE